MNTDLSQYLQHSTGYNEIIIETVIKAFCQFIHLSLKEKETIKIEGLGKFSVKDLPSRRGRNPRTGESLIIPAKRKPILQFETQLIEAIQPPEAVTSQKKKNEQVKSSAIEEVIPPPLPNIPETIWFVNIDQSTKKLSESELRASGVTKNTLVWNQTLDGWKFASDLPQLAYLFT